MDCDAPEDEDDDAVGAALAGMRLQHDYMGKVIFKKMYRYCSTSWGKEKDVILTKSEKIRNTVFMTCFLLFFAFTNSCYII